MTERRNFGTLDLLRGLAALMVLAYHYPGVAQRHYWSAYLSVDLFFVLSGVVVAHAYEGRLRQGWRFWRFAVARVIRLWPLYLLGSGIGAAALAWGTARFGVEVWRFKPVLDDAMRAVLLWPRLTPDTGTAFPLDPPAWSLFCELVINLIYGLVLARARSAWLVLTAAIGAVLTIAGAGRFALADAGINLGALGGHLWVGMARAAFSFPAGVLLYRLWTAGRLPRLAVPPAVLAASFLLLLLAVPGEGRWATPAGLAAMLVALPSLVAAAMQVEPAGRLKRVARITADLSYPIYAIHDAFYLFAGIAIEAYGFRAPAPYLLAFAAALLLAPVVDVFVDRPIRRRLTRLAQLPRKAVTVAAPL